MRVKGYLVWKRELIEEDKKLGIHPVYRSESATRELFEIFKAATPQEGQDNEQD